MRDLSKLEEKIIKKWKEIKAFEESVSRRPKDRTFVFYEGPPTANGKPGFHHVLSRSFKDVICRYKTMRGYRVERRAGWDTHGLPVEIQVEKELGLNNKKEIEEYGVAKFNQKCKESVWRYQQEWEQLTDRMGYWLDLDNAYITYKPLYMESLWSIIKKAHDKDLLFEGHKVVPYCARCGTPLSSHEVAQGYKDVTEDSVYIKFKVKNSKDHNLEKDTYILAWTTTPWTLPGNVALAVGEDIEYTVVKQNDEYLIVATDRLEMLDEGYTAEKTMKGKDLVDVEYEPLFDSLKDAEGKKHVVLAADFVSTEDGTGVVHTAVMYGEDDYNLGKEAGLPTVHTVDEDGRFNELVPEFEGKFVKDVDSAIIDRLKAENQLYKSEPYKHSYPFCWRCGTALLYYAMDSWFIKMSELRKDLIKANSEINWVPSHLKEGRFGEWIKEVKDWAFSRSRYWGTPLPVWKCDNEDCEHVEVVGSREDIAKLTAGKNTYKLLRHGMAGHIKNNVISSSYPDKDKFSLTEEGVEEIKKATKQLKKDGGIDLIVASPITRTKETAEIVAKELGVDIEYNEDILEIKVGKFDGKAPEEYHSYFETEEEEFTKTPPEGENLVDVQKRMIKAMNDLEEKHSGKKILIISHGHPMWILESAMLGLTREEAMVRKDENYPQVGQLRELEYAEFPYSVEGDLDFHRPYVDNITFDCTECKKGKMNRVEDLVDVWFDSGSMPFAQEHYPFENKDKIDKGEYYPADYISEAIDQTRGWFYTLLAVSAVMGKAPAYKNVVSLGHVLDGKGQKMSKSKGNIVDPWEMADKYGMDALRWYFFTVNHPGDTKRFIERDVKERWQKFIGTFANSYSFLNIYAPDVKAPKKYNASSSDNILDKWVYAKLQDTIQKVSVAMDEYSILDAARALDSFVLGDLSNWYIRRSRTRLQRPETKKDKEEASTTLAFVLSELAKVSAPFIPFLSEHIWQELNTDSESVHWQDYPEFAELGKDDQKLIRDMDNIREWAQYGLRLRAENGLKVRQPLSAFAIPSEISDELKDVLKEELNVKGIEKSSEVEKGDDWKNIEDNAPDVYLNISISDELFVEGRVREMVRHIQKMRKSLDLKPEDMISVYYSMPEDLRDKLNTWEEQVAKDTNAEEMRQKDLGSVTPDAEAEFDWDGKRSVAVAIKKHK
ncbi:MAG: class I tRNA ligase family protein [Candidatus Spechtbacterales bacterium]|nr:class I tRNA ligase family protein [Candidatus Spechtbacterales bacterium]